MKKILPILLLLSACEPPVDDEAAVAAEPGARVDTPVYDREPVLAVAHGGLVGPGGDEVVPTPEVVLGIQQYYLEALASRVPAAARDAALRRRAALASERLGDEAAILANYRLLDDLLVEAKDTLPPGEGLRLTEINQFLRASIDPAGAHKPEASRAAESFQTTTSSSGAAYILECAAAGVPIPPAFGPSWTARGELTTEFILSGRTAEVYSYQNANGTCIALPRRVGSTVPAASFGIICQGNRTSKACFWDNPEPVAVGTTVPLNTFVGGGALVSHPGGTCTSCHAGENVFIVHPGTPLDLGAALTAKGWVNPMVADVWPQNRKPGKDLDLVPASQACTSCHNKASGKRFPDLGTHLSGYCNTVAPQAITRTMPSASGGYAAHIAALNAACSTPAAPASTRFGAASLVHTWFAPAGEVPLTGDFDGNGRGDLVTFTRSPAYDVYVGLGDGTAFPDTRVWHPNLGADHEVPGVGDFNGDGKDDVLVFTMSPNHDAWVALSTGSAFTAASPWHHNFGYEGEVPMVGDFDNDRKDDIVVFTKGDRGDVYVALSTGSAFGSSVLWHGDFAFDDETPGVGDVNGDGFDDIVTMTSTGRVFVAVSDGKRFVGTGVLWLEGFAGGSSVRQVADVDGDGFDDLVAFTRGSSADVWVSRSTGSSFAAPTLWHGSFNPAATTPSLVDVDGDRRADAVSFQQGSGADVFVARSQP